MRKLYHGSSTPNLDVIVPNKSGYVYATSELAFALIFSSRERNSLIAKWGMSKNNISYFCESVRDIFDTLYSGKSSHIYVLDNTNFFQNDKTWTYEYILDRKAKVIDEIVVNDIKRIFIRYG
jgi:hypothetical protein